jgi:hypothetical protein
MIDHDNLEEFRDPQTYDTKEAWHSKVVPGFFSKHLPELLLLAIQPRHHAELLRRRCRRWSAISVPDLSREATLLGLLAIKHPARVAGSCEAVDSIDRRLDYT